MSDPKAGSRAALGSRCRELMQSPVFQEAMTAVNAEFERAILSSKPAEAESREELFKEYHALKRVVSRLSKWEQDGVMAQMEIERDN